MMSKTRRYRPTSSFLYVEEESLRATTPSINFVIITHEGSQKVIFLRTLYSLRIAAVFVCPNFKLNLDFKLNISSTTQQGLIEVQQT